MVYNEAMGQGLDITALKKWSAERKRQGQEIANDLYLPLIIGGVGIISIIIIAKVMRKRKSGGKK